MFKIYSHESHNPEADMNYICTCDSKTNAEYVVKALKYFEGGMYDYYIREA